MMDERNTGQEPSRFVRDKAFISYSRSDAKYLSELHAHLKFHTRNGMINFWDDTMIKPGERWSEKITHGLQSAKVAVFLVSAEFLASDFIATRELPPLLTAAAQEGVVILSVILSPSAFKYSPLAQFQTVNVPSNPLSAMTKGQRQAVWVSVAESIKEALKLP
ncbi:hypothetical protein KSF_066560 [Reticulibacter mediterranei]|uniref:TIR domain-containing protein n=1 Tax=Reticulibacter mediterranei TaxID=2778369 RepID=A0A8J3N5L1_9CHLR|nr:toll/interleukin-1 receptor domain-containing protein [Reticulibacter mediterranei]GHO96608.1 hypothetical protein KSF_066560 [Reticulibacter mediterranei]